MLGRYDDCVSALRDPRLGVSIRAWRYAHELQATPLDSVYENGLFALSAERHTRMRKLLSPSFTPRAIATRQPEIQAIVREALDRVASSSEFDLVPNVSAVIPVRVIGRYLGIPRDQEQVFRDFASALVAGVNPVLRSQLPASAFQAAAEGRELLLRLIAERRRHPGTDLLSELIRAEDEGDKLTAEELVTVVRSLVIAGAETTTHLISLGLVNLLAHPTCVERLRLDPKLFPNAVDELLRFDFFGRIGTARYTLEPVAFCGVEIGPGEMVIPMLSAALRDPRRFPDPDHFDIDRDQRFNIAFGQGAHYCLGAALARLEAEVVFSEFFKRYAAIELVDGPHFEPHPVLRNATSIRLRVIPRTTPRDSPGPG